MDLAGVQLPVAPIKPDKSASSDQGVQGFAWFNLDADYRSMPPGAKGAGNGVEDRFRRQGWLDAGGQVGLDLSAQFVQRLWVLLNAVNPLGAECLPGVLQPQYQQASVGVGEGGHGLEATGKLTALEALHFKGVALRTGQEGS